MTRTPEKQVELYLNGNATPIASFYDNFDLAVISQGVLKFFQDDSATGIEYSKSGVAAFIRVWNGALPPSLIPDAMPVPEPSAWVLGLAGFAATAWRSLRRRTA